MAFLESSQITKKEFLSLLQKRHKLFYVHGCFACTYVSVSHVHALPVEVRRVCPLEMELQVVESCHVGAENGTLVRYQAASALNQ